ncbi:carbonic anhydrase [Parazoarcus communis]|uniref:carbonic anhydrase n=2 Tax=Parazoarcus communis TaxID=41977 RepID=UPI001FB3EC53|nr:surface-adhesin E family protein [Parazoarcus communis]
MQLLVAALLSCTTVLAHAADWQLVLSDRGRKVEIDRASIFDSDRGTKVSWGRIVLADDEAAREGYRTVKALNRYDCLNRSFVTIKRVYLDGAERVLKEESVSDQTPVMVARNSADERMWREVCRPAGGGMGDLEKLADAAGKAAAEARPQTGPVPPLRAVEPAPPRATASPPPTTPAARAPAAASTPNAPTSTPLTPAQKLATEASPQSTTPTPAASTPTSQTAPAIPSIRPNLAEQAARSDASAPRPITPSATSATSDIKPITPPPLLTNPSATEVEATPPVATVEAPTLAPVPASSPAPTTRPARTTTPAARPVRPVRPAPTPARPAASTPEPLVAPPSPPQPSTTPALTGWSYTGETGPDRWGKLRPDWRICEEGVRQSPIDLRNGIAVDLEPVKFDYRATQFRITDTGNMLRVQLGDGMSMEVRGKRYALEHLTLHQPSGERVGGAASDMEVNFYHRNAEGEVAMLGVLLERGDSANDMLQTLLNHLPLERGSTYAPDATIDLNGFIPTATGHFLYSGSLTTPPCTEGVIWVVLKTPVTLSEDQLAIFTRLHPRNARPIQPSHGRLLLESR